MAGELPLGAITVDLALVSQEMEARLRAGQPHEAAAIGRIILLRLPRHLATYQRLVRAAWMLKRWPEGEDWARRLLRADPGNPLAWRSLAFAVERKDMRHAARAMWKRAFEADPYHPDIRSGLHRTSLERSPSLQLTEAGLASLYLRSGRWAHAAAAYWSLMQVEPRRIDFQLNAAVALWQNNARQDAYRLGRHLTSRHPHLLLAWVVVNALGNVDDRALARSPLSTMDPDGEFVRQWLGIPYTGGKTPITLTAKEAALLSQVG